MDKFFKLKDLPVLWGKITEVNKHLTPKDVGAVGKDEIISISHGGTGKTTAAEGFKALLDGVQTESTTPTDDDWYLCQWANGTAEKNETPIKRSMLALWNYIKSKFVPPCEKTIDNNFLTKFRTQTKGDANRGAYISAIRNNTADVDGAPQWGSGLAFGVTDTHGYLFTDYTTPKAFIGGGNADKLNWIKELAFTDTWKANTKDNDGYVTKGKDYPSRFWQTDASGNPSWGYVTQMHNAKDNRKEATKPDDYNTRNLLRLVGIKEGSTVGLLGIAYALCLGLSIWDDNSGGKKHELMFGGDGNIFHRAGTGASWNPNQPKKLVEIDADVTIAAHKKNTAYGDRIKIGEFELREAHTNNNNYVHIEFGQPDRNIDQILYFPFGFGIDADGNCGYIKPGADTVTPFLKRVYTTYPKEHNTANTVSYNLGYYEVRGGGYFYIITYSSPNTTANNLQLITDSSHTAYIARITDMSNVPDEVKYMHNIINGVLFRFTVRLGDRMKIYGFEDSLGQKAAGLLYMPPNTYFDSSGNLEKLYRFAFI